MFLYKFFQNLLWLPGKIFMPTKVVGKKNLINDGAVLICNHQSALDIILIGLSIYKQHKILAKQELFENKNKAKFYKSLGGVPINRDKPDLSSIKECIKILKNNQRLLVFPEGTRNSQNNLENFKFGFLAFALKSKKPVIPMWISKKPKFFRFNKLYIGKPIYLDEYFDKKLTPEQNIQMEQKVVNALAELKQLSKGKM